MTALADARVLTRSLTRSEPANVNSDLVADLCAPSTMRSMSGKYTRIEAHCGSISGIVCHAEKTGDLTVVWEGKLTHELDVGVTGWNALERLVSYGHVISTRTRATTVSATTVSTLRGLLRRRMRDERLKRLSPERRAVYDRIRKLREEIGPVEFGIVETLRELRANG